MSRTGLGVGRVAHLFDLVVEIELRVALGSQRIDNHQAPIGLHHARHLLQGELGLFEMMNGALARYQIEETVGVGKLFDFSEVEAGVRNLTLALKLSRLAQHFIGDIDAPRKFHSRGEPQHKFPGATGDIERDVRRLRFGERQLLGLDLRRVAHRRL